MSVFYTGHCWRPALEQAGLPSGATGERLLAMNVPAFIMPGDDALTRSRRLPTE